MTVSTCVEQFSMPAVLVCINQSGDGASKASDEAAAARIRLHTSRSQAGDSGL
jgi:hypothetical protein